MKDEVKYGTVIQLQHVNTGSFLACHKGAAPKDPDTRRISLKHGSPAGQFRFMPRFKAQSEGSTVYYSHSLKVENMKLEGMYLHTSDVAYSAKNNPSDPSLPKSLRAERVLEANCSPQFSTYSILRYARYDASDINLLKTRQPFRLYHSQAESFVHASCNREKDRAPGDPRALEQQTELRHAPFLKKMTDDGEDPVSACGTSILASSYPP